MSLTLNKTTLMMFCLIISISVKAQSILGLDAKIEVIRQDEMISINGFAINNSPSFEENITYKLLVLKKNKIGKYSKDLKTGSFSILSNQRKLLSNVKINIQKGDLLKIYLYLLKNEVLLDRDTTSVVAFEKKFANTSINENNIEIKGLVIDEVMTKFGKDFYDYFYQIYNTMGSNYPFIIKISEKPALGINSKIFIKIDGRLVYSFLTEPKEEFLRNAAQNAVIAVENYNRYRKKLYQNSNY